MTNMITHYTRRNLSTLAIIVSGTSAILVSSALSADTDVLFRGTLIEQPPCIINNENLITVNFGDEVMTTRIDGKNYTQDIIFDLDCSNAVSNIPLKLRIAGSKASFADVLDGDQPGLGIALTIGGKPLKPNEWNIFNSTVKPDLQAVPVMEEGTILEGGAFRVLASLEIEYQ